MLVPVLGSPVFSLFLIYETTTASCSVTNDNVNVPVNSEQCSWPRTAGITVRQTTFVQLLLKVVKRCLHPAIRQKFFYQPFITVNTQFNNQKLLSSKPVCL